MKDIENKTASPRLYLVKSQPTLQRRTYQPASENSKPLTLFVGSLEQDILTALSHFTYASLQQLASLLSREKSVNYLRKKLAQMIDENKVMIIPLPRIIGGKPLQVYYLPAIGERKHQFLEHTLDVNSVLINGVLLPTIVEGLTLIDVKSERTLKTLLNTCPCIPDGLLSLQTKTGEVIHIAFEIDRATENRERIAEKYTSSSVWIEKMGSEAVTLAFIVTTGDSKRVAWLRDIANEVVTDLADALLFGAVASDTISSSLFTSSIFKSLDGSHHALIEQPY